MNVFKLSGINIDDHLLCDAFLRVSLVEGAEQLTYFEFITLAALLIFASADIDFVILEVGLGGRLDAVNIVPPDIALITMIGIDHTELVGRYPRANRVRESGHHETWKTSCLFRQDGH